ncbi:oxygen-regulated protein 1 isoform X1 [Phyllopteryx taeniolatus]|uniref:oxygen-regulated protein 1 isoform X1 n=2 Tax=Phyllopteryx taeniolatus TaxID=161469 RepID=UPI002AD238C8|nr:oxygen-regulated protein 1 isoform X1 [Phyllopteryx taeniolatus]
MSNTPTKEKPVQADSPASGPTQLSRSVQPASDPSLPKRLCFYKSGDHTFGGHRVVINARTFKTFDALLDALSKKVPLPFGVRTITTPQGTHLVKGLDDLQDGGSYLCSDQRRVKPLNLEAVHRRQVPWNTPRAFSAGRRRRQGLQFTAFGRQDDNSGRPEKFPERVAIRTPRRLVVIKNKDPAVRRTIVLQKRTAPTFDALLDYLSQVLQFPVLKLYSIDGRRITGLAALILCSGFLVAAGNESFRLSNQSFHRTSQTVQAMFIETGQPSMLQLQANNHKSVSSGRGSRNFSLSSEQYMINQINKSQKGSANSHARATETNPMCLEPAVTAHQRNACILPQDDDVEKSFRVNQDGSMSVEMKVRLTIKEEEMLHWTTTVSRSSLMRRTVRTSVTESGNISPDSNIYVAKQPSDICKDEAKEGNQPPASGAVVSFNDMGERKKRFRRAPTPGPRHVKKEASVESVKMLTESGVQESSLDHYSYLERTTEGDTMEGYCRVRRSSSSQPVPKPLKTVPQGNNASLLKSSGVAEVLKIENDGVAVRETVMRIYDSQSCYNNYLANEGPGDGPLYHSPPVSQSHQSTTSGPCSSSNDIDFSWQQPTADSLQRQKEELLSLSSEPVSSKLQVANGTSSVSNNEAKTKKNSSTRLQKQTETKKSSQSRLINKKRKQSTVDHLNSKAYAGKKSLSSTESAKSGQNVKLAEKTHPKTSGRRGMESEILARSSTKEKNMNKVAAKYNGDNVDTPSVRPSMKKNVSDLLKLQKSSRKKASTKPIPMAVNRMSSSSLAQQNVSKISLNRSPSEIHQYVENWLEEVIPDPVVYMVTSNGPEPPTKVLFKIGCDSETEEKKETQTDPEDYCQTPSNALRESASCLSFPLWPKEHKATDLSVPNVEPAHHQNCVWSNTSAEIINESPSQISILSPKEKMQPVLQELCSSIQSMRKTSNQSSSPLEFSSQVASVFGSSCKAFLSFLSVMTLRDGLTADSTGSEKASEAMLLLKFLLNISAIEDQDEQRAGLTDLHSGASPQFMKSWRDFQTWRENLERESLIPKFQDAQDAVWVQGLIVDELMKEMNMSWELRMEMSSAFQQPLEEEAAVVEPERNSSESAAVEQHVQDSDLKQGCDNAWIHENTSDKNDDSSWGGEMEEEPAKETGYKFKESKVSLGDTLDFQVDEGNVKGEDDHMEESGEVMNEGEMKQNGNEEDTEEESVREEVGQEEEHGEEGTENEESEEKDEVFEEEGDKTIDELEARENGAETDVTKGDEADVVEEDEDNRAEKTTDEKAENKDVKEEGAWEPVEGDEEVNKEEEEEEYIEDEKDVKDQIGENMEEEGTEVLSDDNNKEGNINPPEATKDKEQVGVLEWPEKLAESEEDTRETNPDEASIDQVEMPGRTKEPTTDAEKVESVLVKQTENAEKDEEDTQETCPEEDLVHEVPGQILAEAESEENLDCSQEPNPEVEGTASFFHEGKGHDNIEESMGEEATEDLSEDNNKKGNTDVDVPKPSPDEEKVDQTEQTDKLEEDDEDTRNSSPEGESVDQVEKSSQTPSEAESEYNLGCSQETNPEVKDTPSPHDERAEEVDEKEDNTVDEKDTKDDFEENMQEEGPEVLNEVNNKEINVDVPKPTTHKKQVAQEEQAEKLEDDEEDTCQMEDSGEEMEMPSQIPTETESEDDLGCFQEPNTEVEGIAGSTDEGVVNKKEDNTEDEVRENDDIEENMEEERREVLSEDNIKTFHGNVAVPELPTDEEQNEKLDEDTCPKEESGEEVEKPNQTPTKTESENNGVEDLIKRCAQKANLEVEVPTKVPGETVCTSPQKETGEEDLSNTEHSTEYSLECLSEERFEKDTVLENEVGMQPQEQSSSFSHPVEISQELLDFVNSALQSSSLIFTYDDRGKIRIEPDCAQITEMKQTLDPKSQRDFPYGSKCLESPITSDLSDYRPESLESGGYQSQESVDIASESGEDASERPPEGFTEGTNPERATAKIFQGHSKGGSFSSDDSLTKASREVLSYCKKVDNDPVPKAETYPEPSDGVLIDQGRWLLKENHLIRNSPPDGMYRDLDSSSDNTENSSEESHPISQDTPLAVISSSELEELAKPQPPRCSYFTMPHGSDSDPFPDDASDRSQSQDTICTKGRGFRVSPVIDTSKTRANKNGSLSSFTSVEFKIADRRVHPEEAESSGGPEARGNSRGRLQSQHSSDVMNMRCGQYCEIL